MNKKVLELARKAQKNEITEHVIYHRLARKARNEKNKKVLEHIAGEELSHYNFWRSITGEDFKPEILRVNFFVFLSSLLGLSFGLKLMEKGEHFAKNYYSLLSKHVPEAEKILVAEHKHEQQLLEMIEENQLDYAGAIVLGLNDALVELTGALAGLSLALGESRVIGVIGLITGIAASMSMAASGYMASREDKHRETNPATSAIYTGFAYIITVLLLVFPYFVFQNVFFALATMLATSLLIIFSYNFYIAVAKGVSFRKRFLEMSAISLSVAVISFFAGFVLKNLFGV